MVAFRRQSNLEPEHCTMTQYFMTAHHLRAVFQYEAVLVTLTGLME